MDDRLQDDDVDSRRCDVMLANTDLGTLSLMAYLVGASVAIWCFFGELHYVPATLHIVIVFASGLAVDKDNFDVWWRGAFLGVVLSLGILLSSSSGGPYFRYQAKHFCASSCNNK